MLEAPGTGEFAVPERGKEGVVPTEFVVTGGGSDSLVEAVINSAEMEDVDLEVAGVDDRRRLQVPLFNQYPVTLSSILISAVFTCSTCQ